MYWQTGVKEKETMQKKITFPHTVMSGIKLIQTTTSLYQSHRLQQPIKRGAKSHISDNQYMSRSIEYSRVVKEKSYSFFPKTVMSVSQLKYFYSFDQNDGSLLTETLLRKINNCV